LRVFLALEIKGVRNDRGQKEASSELLNAICEALGLTLSSVMTGVAHEIKSRESAKLSVVDAA
jgi:hypothetical protein